jgi:uncharacterized membrane protein
MFQKNESTADRVIRLVVGAALVVLAFAALGVTSGNVLGIIVAVVGAVLLFTAATGSCLLYKLFEVNTAK